MPEEAQRLDGESSDILSLVLGIVRELAGELGGARARHAVAPGASLERDIGLGSLERVELLLRIEAVLGRRLEDSALALDTPEELVRAIETAGPPLPQREHLPERSVRAARPLEAPPKTVHEALLRHAEREGERTHAILREDSHEEVEITYGRLLQGASAVAGGLRVSGVKRGETVALMLPTGFDFLRTFMGTLIAGAIPVPIYPPARLDRLQEYALRQSAILADAGVRVLVTARHAAAVAHLLRPRAPSLTRVTTADDLAALGASWPAGEGSGKDAAFIQYTSGSTGHPKGVLLTHDNLLANIKAIGHGVGVRPTDVGVSWLPLYHDMGLIGSWLFCLVGGLPISILSPLAFLSHPDLWLRTIHARRGTLSAAPNFAYEICARRIPEQALDGLDLSAWRCALNGAEPVNPGTLDRFARRFAPYGFRAEAMMPVYGLAENSVALCFPAHGRPPRIDSVARGPFETLGRAAKAEERDAASLKVVGVGTPLPEHEVRILDDSGADAEERVVGRLVFRGPSMMPGYFRKAEDTARITLPGGWLDSGDLAYRADGEIFITGRKKDLIIKGGRNFVPQEIEELAAGVAGVRRGCVVSFGTADETQATERLVVVAESRRRDQEAQERISLGITEALASTLGVAPDDVVIVAPGTVPKTSSGKVRRAATKDLYLRGVLGEREATTLLQRIRLAAGYVAASLAPPLRRAGRAIYAFYLGLTILLLALALWPILLLLPTRRAVFRLERFAARLALLVSGCSLALEGGENLNSAGPLLMVSNHTSYIDVLVLLALVPRDFVFVAKREVLRWPIVGSFVRRARHLTVDRSSAQDSLTTASNVARALETGESLLLFPEATFTSVEGLRPFRLGAFKTAVETGVPILPLVLVGSRSVLRDGTFLPRPGPIRVWVGAPMEATGATWRDAVELRDKAREVVAAHCGEPRIDSVVAGPVAS